MNAYAVGHFHFLTLKGHRSLELDINFPTLLPHRARFYNRVLMFEDLRIYIEKGVKVCEQHLSTENSSEYGAGTMYVAKDIDLVATKDGKLALIARPAEANDSSSIFIGNTIDIEYFNATICGEVECGQDMCACDNNIFSEYGNGFYSTIIFSDRSSLETKLNNPERCFTTTNYHTIVAIVPYKTIIRHGPFCDSKAAYFYTHNEKGEFVAAWVDTEGDILIENIKSRLESTYDSTFGNIPEYEDQSATAEFVEKLFDDNIWLTMHR